ncbi:MAG TPA: hypothetical protein DC006_06435 [Prevotellaceae bacterium]|nr:hypothetical protein [Prevotellaceae bacterium]HBE55303.1 hypothetical protein [Prevotellaceae bacterium]
MKNNLQTIAVVASSGYVSALGAFVNESLAEISVWLLVMVCVIATDLFAKWFKILKLRDEPFRISKGTRDTLAKMVVYFAAVVTSVFVQHAMNADSLARWTCGMVIGVEGISIAGNLLRANGYRLDTGALIAYIAGKAHVPEDIIKEEERHGRAEH